MCNFFIRSEYRFGWKYCMLTLIFYADQSNFKFMRSILTTKTILVVYMHLTLQFHFYENGKNGIHRIITLITFSFSLISAFCLSKNYLNCLNFFEVLKGKVLLLAFDAVWILKSRKKRVKDLRFYSKDTHFQCPTLLIFVQKLPGCWWRIKHASCLWTIYFLWVNMFSQWISPAVLLDDLNIFNKIKRIFYIRILDQFWPKYCSIC